MSGSTQVTFLGLADDERETIAACLRLSSQRQPHYAITHAFDQARCVIADAEHAPAVQMVLASERLAQTVFVGAGAPPGAVAQLPRPVDPGRLLRELDQLLGVATPRSHVRPAPTALLVDDSEVALQFLEMRLLPYGFATDRAMNSQRALELVARQQYDFVFVDVELGRDSELDGLALCQHIKRQQDTLVFATAVVLVSAHAGDADRVRASLAGCDAFFPKPLDAGALSQLLARHGISAQAPTAASH